MHLTEIYNNCERDRCQIKTLIRVEQRETLPANLFPRKARPVAPAVFCRSTKLLFVFQPEFASAGNTAAFSGSIASQMNRLFVSRHVNSFPASLRGQSQLESRCTADRKTVARIYFDGGKSQFRFRACGHRYRASTPIRRICILTGFYKTLPRCPDTKRLTSVKRKQSSGAMEEASSECESSLRRPTIFHPIIGTETLHLMAKQVYADFKGILDTAARYGSFFPPPVPIPIPVPIPVPVSAGLRASCKAWSGETRELFARK